MQVDLPKDQVEKIETGAYCAACVVKEAAAAGRRWWLSCGLGVPVSACPERPCETSSESFHLPAWSPRRGAARLTHRSDLYIGAVL